MSGIPFSADMVIANLEGRKDMTRRVVGFTVPNFNKARKQAMILEEHESFKSVIKTSAGGFVFCSWDIDSDPDKAKYVEHYANDLGVRCPYGKVGDSTYGKEALIPVWDGQQDIVTYAADKKPVLTKYNYPTLWQWKVRTLPSIFMPRFLSRLALIIREVRVERLLAITDSDARREGFADREHFLAYWDKLNGKRGFESKVNPWVWVVGYEVKR